MTEKAARRAETRTTVLEIIAAALIVTGVALWSVPLAFVVAGVALLLIAHPIPIPMRRWRR